MKRNCEVLDAVSVCPLVSRSLSSRRATVQPLPLGSAAAALAIDTTGNLYVRDSSSQIVFRDYATGAVTLLGPGHADIEQPHAFRLGLKSCRVFQPINGSAHHQRIMNHMSRDRRYQRPGHVVKIN